MDLDKVERLAKIKLKRVGGPTTEDIIQDATNDATKSLELVPEKTMTNFKDSAAKLTEQHGA